MTMNIKELTIIVAALAKPRGFKRKGTMFYATGTETTAMLHLQKSRWDSGVYVNTGVLPNAMCVRKYPPSVGYWMMQDRAYEIASPFKEYFLWLGSGDDRDFEDDAPVEVFGWLLDWLAQQYLDARALTETVRAGPFHNERGILEDWVRGELQPPRSYWPATPYYRDQ